MSADSLRLNFFQNTVSSQLNRNPTISNSDLAGVMRANIVGFRGRLQVSDCAVHSFKSDGYEGINKPAKIIYISPYEGFLSNLFVSIKRIFIGVVFGHSNSNGDLRLDLAQGRRVTIFCALDGSEAEAVIEVNQKGLFFRIYQTVFSCCQS